MRPLNHFFDLSQCCTSDCTKLYSANNISIVVATLLYTNEISSAHFGFRWGLYNIINSCTYEEEADHDDDVFCNCSRAHGRQVSSITYV